MLRLSIRTHDDRDRAIRLPLSSVGWIVRAWWGGVEVSRRGRMRGQIRGQIRGQTRGQIRGLVRGLVRGVWRLVRFAPAWVALGGVGLLTILVLLMVHDTAMGLGLLIISPVMSPLVAVALITTRGMLGLGGLLPQRVRDDALMLAHCPRCAYALGELVCEADQCLTCPECGAAWNWDAIGDRAGGPVAGGRRGARAEVVVIAPMSTADFRH